MIRLFQVFIPTSVLALLISEIAVLYFCYTLASFLLIDAAPDVYLLYEGGLGRISLVVVSIVLGLYFEDLYSTLRVRFRILLAQQISMALGLAFLAQALLTYFNPELTLPRLSMILGSTLALPLLLAWRLLYSGVVLRHLAQQRVLFVGTTPVVHQIARRIAANPELGFTTVGFVEEVAGGGVPPDSGRVVGCMAELRKTVEEVKPDRIVVGVSERRSRLPVYDLLDLRLSGIRIDEASSIYEIAFGRVCTRELRPSQLIYSAELGPAQHKVTFQTAYSLVMAGVGTLLALPVMLVVALLIKLSSAGPVLYRQVRVGVNDVPFVLYKFRSMAADAEAETGAVWAQANDPRVTPLGRWLRLLRLDELPQLLNVLRGEMAIVGPRPERPEFVKTLSEQIPYYRQRHCVKPGITGWAQINYKYGNTLEDTITKLEYDLYYIKNLSFSLDFYIIFNTVKTMLLFRGAH
jgi:sugar transferase (PEP-CTERM system associated)